MGLLVNGVWHDRWYENGPTGHFVRDQSAFRNWVTPDGSPGPSGTGGFNAAPGRYHLYVSLAYPWAHRTLIFRKLKNSKEPSLFRLSIRSWASTDGRSRHPMVR
ncbi:MAG TPA: hypothetical protein VGY99_02065 [Candidatus Binataceae bacterium]|jgi:putative glutathione S-transferase|nr:hypothetical protein [Candidatus Binataceae bacterium]